MPRKNRAFVLECLGVNRGLNPDEIHVVERNRRNHVGLSCLKIKDASQAPIFGNSDEDFHSYLSAGLS